MANVTYLLGAGASANCLPTYINFFDRFQKFRNVFREPNQFFSSLDSTQRNIAIEIRNIIDKVSEEFQFHNTPDTIAKKYFHTNNGSTNLRELKEVLILFFLYQQILNQKDFEKKTGDPEFRQPLDKRYDAFMASLLKPIKEKLKLYDQFKILTWNYDLQFEIAYSRYTSQTIPYCQKRIQSYPIIIPEGNEKFDINKFGVIHLNGIAYARGASFTVHKDFLGSFFNDDQHVLAYLTDIYRSLHTVDLPDEIGGTKLLSFAWEKQNEDGSIADNDILNKAIEVASQTQILVIIGYSFPIFNNSIDKKLFEKMTRLRKVYIQSPKADDIKNILLDLPNISLEKINDVGYTSQFYIPSEWNKDIPSFN